MASKVSTVKVGDEFGRLKVEAFVEKNGHRKRVWRCRCRCGTVLDVVGSSLPNSNTNSCGCHHLDKITTHGKSKRCKEYRVWCGMIQRCTNTNNPDWDHYGGRGITVCDEWMVFENFYRDMGDCPPWAMSIDRRDNNAGYSPNNCRWATRAEQDRNKRTNRLLTFNGETRCLTEWAEIVGMDPSTLSSRIRGGMDVESALTTPVRRRS